MESRGNLNCFKLLFCNCVNLSSPARIIFLLDFHSQIKLSLFDEKNVISFQLVIKVKGRRKLGTKYTVVEYVLFLSKFCLESNPQQ